MECYHGILSFDHKLSGSLTINNNDISFENGRGYLEKDWGSSFPKYYIWIQSNHFGESGISLMASVANVPWLGHSFDGFIVGFLFQGKIYRFTTYTNAKIVKLKLFHNRVIVHFSNNKHLIEIEAIRHSESGELKSPILGSMDNRIRESLTSEVSVSLFELSNNNKTLIFNGISHISGFEMGGEIEKMKEIL